MRTLRLRQAVVRAGLVGIDLWATDSTVPPRPFELAGVTFAVVPRAG